MVPPLKICKVCGRSDVQFYPRRATCKKCVIHHIQNVYGRSEKGSAVRAKARKDYKKTIKGQITRRLYNKENPQAIGRAIIYKGVHQYIRNSGKGCIKFRKYVGCTPEEFRNYLESLFVSTMSWENYGTMWEVDHIIPLVNFDLRKPEQFAAACNYTNCRPFPKKDNNSRPRKNKYPNVGVHLVDTKEVDSLIASHRVFDFTTSPISPLDDPEDME